MENYAGRVLKSYEIKEMIDMGGFAIVYRANQAVIDREVAIKIIWPHFASTPEFIRQFEMEAQLIAGLEHPHIVPLYDYWRDPNGAYIVMRWLKGGHLRSVFARGLLSLEDTLRIMRQLTSALAFAHRYGVVHCDLKPENILLDESDNAYLADFGISQILNRARASDNAGSMGSPAYAAPEQFTGRDTSPKVDQFSLGVVLFEMLAGVHPFPDIASMTSTEIHALRTHKPLPPLVSVRPDLPEAVGVVIQRATALNPDERFADITEMMQAFEEALTPIIEAGGAALYRAGHRDSAAVPQIPNPYKGLRTFQEADAANFFGREALVALLLRRLHEDSPYTRFLAVVGPSGSGKSSVVKAGLIPRLRRGALRDSDHWYYVEMVPSAQPFRELSAALTSVAVDAPADLQKQLTDAPHRLAELTRSILPDKNAELLLFIDQFEELFTLVEDDALINRFLDCLVSAVTTPGSGVRVVLTLRADFYDRPLLRPQLGEIFSQRTQLVLPMTPQELDEAVTRPATRVGVLLERGLSASIIAEVREQPGTLPLLQYLMSELFERRRDDVMTLAAYSQMGGVRGALAKRADELYANFNDQEKAAMQQLFLRLVTLGEGTEDTRRRVPLGELNSLSSDAPSVIRRVIEVVGASRLLTFDRDPDTRTPTLEVAHEAIIREWGRLRNWLDTSRNDVRLQRMLALLANEWAAAGHDPSYLLRDTRLRQFESWHRDSAVALTEGERTFLLTSIDAQKQRETVEIRRIEHERALEKRSRSFLRILVVVMALALGVGIILTALALDQSRRAQIESRVALSLAGSANARRALDDGDGDTAIALALASSDMDDPPAQTLQTLAEVALAPGTRAVLVGHESEVLAVDISPDGHTLVSTSRDGTLRLWDAATGTLRAVLDGHRGDVGAVRFSRDGTRAATGSLDFSAILWDAATGQAIHQLEGHAAEVSTLDFSPDDRYLVTGSRDRHLILWDAATGTALRRFDGSGAEVLAARFSPDGTHILSGAGNGALILWDAQTGQSVRQFTDDAVTPSAIYDLTFTSDGTRAVAATANRELVVWDVETGTVIRSFSGLNDTFRAIELNTDNSLVLAGSLGGSLVFFDLESGREVLSLRGHTATVFGVALSNDGGLAATASGDGTVRLWNTGSSAESGILIGHSDDISGLHFSGRGLVSGSRDGTIRVWDTVSQVATRQFASAAGIRAFTVGDGWAVAGLENGLIEVWNLDGGQLQGQYPIHASPVRALAVDRERELVVSGSTEGGLTLWRLSNGETLDSIESGAVFDASISPDGSLLAYTGDGNSIVLWDVENRAVRSTLSGHTGAVFSVAFSPDGERLVTGARDNTAIVWDVDTASEISQYGGHGGIVWSAVFSPDGQTVASAASDGTVVWWDSATGSEIQRFTTASAARVSMDSSGRLIASGANDGSIALWRVFPLEELKAWARDNRYVRDLTCFERALYRVEPLCEAAPG